MAELLQVSGLSKSFRVGDNQRLLAVAGVDFTVVKGEVLGLIGESGSGKTTVGRCIAGLTEPDAGTISWSVARPTVGMVFQEPRESVNPQLSIGDSIADVLLAKGVRRRSELLERVLAAAQAVRLRASQLDQKPSELSDEVIQRAAVARALVVNPDLMILDEPTTALDADSRAGVLNLLQEIRERREITSLLITHDLSAVQQVADRIYIMYLGLIMESAPTEAAFQKPLHPYTYALLGSHLELDPMRPPQPVELVGEIPNPLNRPAGCPLSPRCPWAADLCRGATPPLAAYAPDHEVACVRVHEIQEGRRESQTTEVT